MRVGKFIREFATGIRYRIPPCCCARFAWDIAHDRFPTAYRANPDFKHGVPCGIFHRSTGTLRYVIVKGHRVPIASETVGPDYEPVECDELRHEMLYEDDDVVAFEFIPVNKDGDPIYVPAK